MNLVPPADDFEDSELSSVIRAVAAAHSTWVSVAINLVLGASHIFIGFRSKSRGLVADDIHSRSDLFADFVVILADRESRRDADQGHPYGHRKFETAAQVALGLLLPGIGTGMSQAAMGKLQVPESLRPVQDVGWWVAGASHSAKGLLFRYMLRVAKRVKSSMLVGNAWHAQSDAASSRVVGVAIIGNPADNPMLDPVPR